MRIGRRARGAAKAAARGIAWRGIGWAGIGWLGIAIIGVAAAATTGRERLAADLEILTKQQMANNKEIPDRDKPRTAKCLAQAIVTDVPDADAARLSDMFNRRAKFDQALERQWLTIGRKDAPARYQQVINAVQKLCPDLGPYIEPMF